MEVSGEESGKVDKFKLEATAHANNSDILNKYYNHSSPAIEATAHANYLINITITVRRP